MYIEAKYYHRRRFVREEEARVGVVIKKGEFENPWFARKSISYDIER